MSDDRMRWRRAPSRTRASIVALAAVWSLSLQAHELREGTARITLRDAHVDIWLDGDLFALCKDDPTTIATSSDDVVTRARDEIATALVHETSLVVDGRSCSLAVRRMPGLSELRATAALLSSRGERHGQLLGAQLECDDAFSDARAIALRAPPQLGPMLISFVQPASSYVAPGGEARFGVLVAEARKERDSLCAHDLPVGLVAGLGILALCVGLALRRR